MKKLKVRRKQPLYKFYKLCEEDIWGNLIKRVSIKLNHNFFNILLRFYDMKVKKFDNKRLLERFFRVDYVLQKESRKFKSIWYLSFIYSRKFRMYYNQSSIKSLKNVLYKYNNDILAKYKSFLLLFEFRLETILYRMYFAKTMREAKQLILNKVICVNNKIINKSNYFLKNNDIFSINIKYRLRYYLLFLYRFKNNYLNNYNIDNKEDIASLNYYFYNVPVYFEMNWRNFTGLICLNLDYNIVQQDIPLFSGMDLGISFNHIR